MERLVLFGILAVLVVIISWHTLFHVKSHGFSRFFGLISMMWLFSFNYKYWFSDPFAIHQLVSWIFLFLSLCLAITGFFLIKKIGKPGSGRKDETLFSFEKTVEIVEVGVYRYIRHPLYLSLILLGWAIFLKNPDPGLVIYAVILTFFFYITSLRDEKECIEYFGEKYRDYMKRTRMFIPFVF